MAGQLLPADLYLRAGRAQSSAYLGEELQAAIAVRPASSHLEFTRHDQLRLGDGQSPGRPDRPAAAGRWPARLPLVGAGAAFPLAGALDIGGDGRSVRLATGEQSSACRWAAWRANFMSTASGATILARPVRLMIDLAVYRQMTGDLRVNDAAITVDEPMPSRASGQPAAWRWPMARHS
jgi:putative ABC transport system permease protein